MKIWGIYRTPILGRFQIVENEARLQEIRTAFKSKYWPGGNSASAEFVRERVRRWQLLEWINYEMRQKDLPVHPKVLAKLEDSREWCHYWGYTPYEDLMLWEIGDQGEKQRGNKPRTEVIRWA